MEKPVGVFGLVLVLALMLASSLLTWTYMHYRFHGRRNDTAARRPKGFLRVKRSGRHLILARTRWKFQY